MFMLQNDYTKKDMIWYIKTFNDGTHCQDELSCAYESEGNHCAVGCFIPWEHPAMKEQDTGLYALMRLHPDLLNHMPLSMEGMDVLQEVHDKWTIAQPHTLRKTLLDWVRANVR